MSIIVISMIVPRHCRATRIPKRPGIWLHRGAPGQLEPAKVTLDRQGPADYLGCPYRGVRNVKWWQSLLSAVLLLNLGPWNLGYDGLIAGSTATLDFAGAVFLFGYTVRTITKGQG